VSAGVGFPAFRRDADLLHAVHDAVVAHVRREVELAVPLHERHVRLALDDGLGVLLAAGLGDVADVLDFVGGRVIAEHLRADLIGLRTQHVVDPPVAGGAHSVVGVVRQGEARVVDSSDQVRPGRSEMHRQADGQRENAAQVLHIRVSHPSFSLFRFHLLHQFVHLGHDHLLDRWLEGAGQGGVEHRAAPFIAALVDDAGRGHVAEDVV